MNGENKLFAESVAERLIVIVLRPFWHVTFDGIHDNGTREEEDAARENGLGGRWFALFSLLVSLRVARRFPQAARHTLNNSQCVLPAKQPLHGRSVIIYVRFTRIVSAVSVRQTNKGEGILIPWTIIFPCPPLSDTRIGLSRQRQKPLIAPIRRHLPSRLVIILVDIVVLLFFCPFPPTHTHTFDSTERGDKSLISRQYQSPFVPRSDGIEQFWFTMCTSGNRNIVYINNSYQK